MLIEIDKNIVESALNTDSKYREMSVLFLHLMAYCAKVGKHIVYIPCLGRKKTNLSQQFRENFSISEYQYLSYVGKKFSSDIQRIKKSVNIYTYVSVNKNVEKENFTGEPIEMYLDEIGDFEVFTETFLLTENIQDADFYKYLCKFFKDNNGLGKFKTCKYSVMGGGSQIYKAFQYEINEKKHFCFAIADSDKKYPSDNIGNTAQNLLNLRAKFYTSKSCIAYAYVNSNFREIENLVPKSVLIEIINGRHSEDISSYDLAYYDLKRGLTYLELFDNGVAEYWKTIFNPEIFNERDKLVIDFPVQENYCKEIKRKKETNELIGPLKPGVGDAFLEEVLETYANKMDNIKIDDLFDYQREVWNELGKLLFSWTCAIKYNVSC